VEHLDETCPSAHGKILLIEQQKPAEHAAESYPSTHGTIALIGLTETSRTCS
jgi:hypothetical protein